MSHDSTFFACAKVLSITPLTQYLLIWIWKIHTDYIYLLHEATNYSTYIIRFFCRFYSFAIRYIRFLIVNNPKTVSSRRHFCFCINFTNTATNTGINNPSQAHAVYLSIIYRLPFTFTLKIRINRQICTKCKNRRVFITHGKH